MMGMNLDQFTEIMREEIEKFDAWWKLSSEKDPSKFPMEMADGNEGLWWEMFSDFEHRKK